MDSELLKEIVIEQQKVLETRPVGIERNGLEQLKEYFTLPHVVIIAGIRRAGKSTLLSQIQHSLQPNGAYYFNFEDERLLDFQVADFNRLYEVLLELYGERKIFFFDEIQNVQGWERFVRRMNDRGFKFFITGSNASLLSRELGTKLTGRHVSYTLYPFSFQEYLLFQGYQLQKKDMLETTKRAVIKKHFIEYIQQGGMPEYLTYHNPESVQEVYNNILYRDIIVRYGITETKSLRELSLYLLSNIGVPFSFNGLKKVLGLGSMNTVKSYIEYLENSFLFFTLNLYQDSVKRQIIAPKKVYSIDTAFIDIMGFRFSENQGRLLENIVFLELLRRGGDIYYYKTEQKGEVDFLIRQNKKQTAIIQVSWRIEDEKTKQREVQNLIAAMDELHLERSLLLTYDTSETIKVEKKTITVQPVYQWLVEKS